MATKKAKTGTATKPKTSKKTKPETLDSRYWKPETFGDSIDGKFKGIIKGMFNPSLVIETKTGERIVNVNTVIDRLLRHNEQYKLLKPNASIRIEYVAQGKGKRGRKSNIFEVYIGGKKLESDIGSVETDVGKFFQ
jgi:hypothetical protein